MTHSSTYFARIASKAIHPAGAIITAMLHQLTTNVTMLFRMPNYPGNATTKDGSARRVTAPDLAIASTVLLSVMLHIVAANASVGWWSAAGITMIQTALLLVLAICWSRIRPILVRLLIVGIVAGICELFTDASGHYIVGSLTYPANEPFLWASPLYMPLSWLVVITQLGYLAWRLQGIYGYRISVPLAGLIGALNIPFYEEMAYRAGWWHYAPVRLLWHTPLYVLLFEGLVVAALPLLLDGLERRQWKQGIAVGIAIGTWMPFAALFAWFLLGRQ